MLMNVFLKDKEYCRLLQYGQRSPEYQIWLGIGIGNSMLEAKSRAHMALNHAVADRSGSSYLVENEQQVAEALEYDGLPPAEQARAFFAKKLQMGTDTLEKLQRVLRQYGDTMTSEELAQRLNITPRSVNRIIARLEEEGYVTIVGKRSTGKGRPARVMKLVLPDIPSEEETSGPDGL